MPQVYTFRMKKKMSINSILTVQLLKSFRGKQLSIVYIYFWFGISFEQINQFFERKSLVGVYRLCS